MQISISRDESDIYRGAMEEKKGIIYNDGERVAMNAVEKKRAERERLSREAPVF